MRYALLLQDEWIGTFHDILDAMTAMKTKGPGARLVNEEGVELAKMVIPWKSRKRPI